MDNNAYEHRAEQSRENAAIAAHLAAGGKCWHDVALADVMPEPDPSEYDAGCPDCGHTDALSLCPCEVAAMREV